MLCEKSTRDDDGYITTILGAVKGVGFENAIFAKYTPFII